MSPLTLLWVRPSYKHLCELPGTLMSIFCNTHDWNIKQLIRFLLLDSHKSRYVCECPKACMMQGWTTAVFKKLKYIQIGKSKFRWMKGGKGANIDSYAWAQTGRGDFNLPLKLWIMTNTGSEGNLLLRVKYRNRSFFLDLFHRINI